jgi:rhodanese-related sulfurtransferase
MNPAAHRRFKDGLFRELARVGRALANPHRLELLDLLAQGERTVDALARLTGMSLANTSQHLQVLRGGRLVSVRREGSSSYYRLAGDGVFDVWRAVRDLGQTQLAEIDRLVQTFVSARARFRSVSAPELLQRMREGDVLVLDVRPALEYAAGHIAGARSVPVDELEKRLKRIPKSREIVAYCRGPLCVFADEAVARLRRKGYRARRLDVGFPDWRAAGLPVTGPGGSP